MRIPAALGSSMLLATLCASVASASDKFETFDYPGAYAQRFDGVGKGSGADRGNGVTYDNRFTAIPDRVPGDPGAFGSLGTLRSLHDLMSGPRAIDAPGSATTPGGNVAAHRLQAPIRVEPKVEAAVPAKSVSPATGNAAPVPRATSVEPTAGQKGVSTLSGQLLIGKQRSAR